MRASGTTGKRAPSGRRKEAPKALLNLHEDSGKSLSPPAPEHPSSASHFHSGVKCSHPHGTTSASGALPPGWHLSEWSARGKSVSKGNRNFKSICHAVFREETCSSARSRQATDHTTLLPHRKRFHSIRSRSKFDSRMVQNILMEE